VARGPNVRRRDPAQATVSETTAAHAEGFMPLKLSQTEEMWANTQRDGRPVEYRWRPLFNAAKFG